MLYVCISIGLGDLGLDLERQTGVGRMHFLILMSTYLFSILMVWGAMFHLTRDMRGEAGWRFFFLALGLGPLVLSRLLAAFLLWVPGQEGAFYVAAVLVVLLGLGAGGASCVLDFVSEKWSWSKWNLFLGGKNALFSLLTLLLLFLVVVGAVSVPLFANDPLEYAQAARLVFESRDLALYPFVDSTVSRGFYGPWTHPPGFVSLLVWSNLIQGHADFPGLIRVPPVYFSVTTCLLLWNIGGKLAGPLSAIALVTVPIFFQSAVISHIDCPRVFTVLAVMALIQLCVKRPTARYGILAGIALGLCMYIHSIGVLILPMAAIIFVHNGSGEFFRRAGVLGLITAVAVLMVLPAYIANVQNLGSIVADSPPVWAIEELSYARHMQAVRQLDTGTQRIVFGALKGWTKLRSYSLTYWWFLAALVVFLWDLHKRIHIRVFVGAFIHSFVKGRKLTSLSADWLWISLVVIGCYFGMTALSLVLGMDAFIKNDRYLLTVQPFYSLFTGLVFANWIEKNTLVSKFR